MYIKDFLSEQLERESEITRRVLKRVPEGKSRWKPHEKSMELGYLASLVAVMPSWIEMMIKADQFDIAAPSQYQPTPDPSQEELIQILNQSLEKAKTALAQTTDEHLETNWKLIANGYLAAEGKRYIFISDSVITHLTHHRGQLSVYLRLLNEPVPSLYGPSADERSF